MNKLFLKACNSVNYQTYNNIKFTLLVSSGLVSLSNLSLFFSGATDGYVGYVSSLLYFSYAFLDISNGQNYTKDVNELRTLYNEFIKKYNIMNRDFSFKEPISMYTMFNFLLNHGYLSKDKKFNCINNDCCDFNKLYGADIIRGNGVCRHISSLFTDILNDYGIPSMNVVTYVPYSNFLFTNVINENYSREKNISIISTCIDSLEERKKIIDNLIVLEENGIYISVEYTSSEKNVKKEKKYGNHVITYSLYDNKSYYLDPTLDNIYRLIDIKNGIIGDDNNNITFKTNQFYRWNNLSDKEIKDYIKKMQTYQDSISVLEEDNIISSTMDICVDNIDVFEKFYNDNNELYNEISNKLVKIKKKR